MALPKNRKKKQLNVRLLPVPLTIGVMALSTYALGWIWLECRCEALGRDIKRLEDKRTALERKCQIEQNQWARMKSPRNLEYELERRGIEMDWPRKDQVVRISKEALVAEINGLAGMQSQRAPQSPRQTHGQHESDTGTKIPN